jgi:hypothetical protein
MPLLRPCVLPISGAPKDRTRPDEGKKVIEAMRTDFVKNKRSGILILSSGVVLEQNKRCGWSNRTPDHCGLQVRRLLRS